MFKALVVLSALASTVYSNFYINSPVQGTVWKGGEQTTITWLKIEPEVSDVQRITITLMNGPDSNGKALVDLATNVSPEATSVSFTAPNDLPSASDYFVQMKGFGASGRIVYKYSTRFTLTTTGPTRELAEVAKGYKGDGTSSATKVATGALAVAAGALVLL